MMSARQQRAAVLVHNTICTYTSEISGNQHTAQAALCVLTKQLNVDLL